MLYFDHWTKVPADIWRWPNFSPEEIACRGTGAVGIDFDAMDKLQALRELLGVPIILNSAYRSRAHNTAVGGAKQSEHLKAKAYDVSMINHDPKVFEAAARKVGFTGFGFYKRNNFIHIDTGKAREWGKRWLAAITTPNQPASRFSQPVITRPERLRDDKTLIGATLGTGGVAAFVAPASSLITGLSPVAQTIAVAGILLLAGGLIILGRHKLREWR